MKFSAILANIEKKLRNSEEWGSEDKPLANFQEHTFKLFKINAHRAGWDFRWSKDGVYFSRGRDKDAVRTKAVPVIDGGFFRAAGEAFVNLPDEQ